MKFPVSLSGLVFVSALLGSLLSFNARAEVTLLNVSYDPTREVVVGGLYLSHSDYAMSFAMADSDSARLVIDWRDGRRTEIPHVRPNRTYDVSQKNATRPAPVEPMATGPLGGIGRIAPRSLRNIATRPPCPAPTSKSSAPSRSTSNHAMPGPICESANGSRYCRSQSSNTSSTCRCPPS